MSERAEKLCSESVQPYLGSVLEELMEPVSSGFQEGRRLSETLMDEVCRDALQGDIGQVKKVSQNSGSHPLTWRGRGSIFMYGQWLNVDRNL